MLAVFSARGRPAGLGVFHHVCRKQGAVGQLGDSWGCHALPPSPAWCKATLLAPVSCSSLISARGALDLRGGVAASRPMSGQCWEEDLILPGPAVTVRS